jgi:flagellar secretion chaperone FliS
MYMMVQQQQKQKYQAYVNATQTVAKTKQIVLLYDGAIRFVQQAKEAIREKRIEDRYNMLVKANDIIGGLQSCLDFEHGGHIAKVLYSYYSSIESRIFSIHRSNSIEACDDVIGDLKQMRDVWHEIDQNNGGGEVVSTPSPESGQNNPNKPDENVTLSA